MRKFLAIILSVAVLICAFIIVRPRLWVKNKTAKVIYDGRLSEDIALFHGSDERLLFYLRDEQERAYFYSAESGLLRCEASAFKLAKIIAISIYTRPECPAASSAVIIHDQSLGFVRSGHNVVVSWQAAPR